MRFPHETGEGGCALYAAQHAVVVHKHFNPVCGSGKYGKGPAILSDRGVRDTLGHQR